MGEGKAPRSEKLLVTIDQAHRLHKQTAKPAGRVTAGAASASDKRVNAAIAATKALTPEEFAVFAEWFAEYRSDTSGKAVEVSNR